MSVQSKLFNLLVSGFILVPLLSSAQSYGQTLTPGFYISDGQMCDAEVHPGSTTQVLVTRAMPSAGGVQGAKQCTLRPYKSWYRIANTLVYNFEGTMTFPASMRILSSTSFVHNSPLGTHVYRLSGH